MMITLTEEQIVLLRDALLADTPVPDPVWYSDMVNKLEAVEENAQSLACEVEGLELSLNGASNYLNEAENYLIDVRSEKRDMLRSLSELQEFIENKLDKVEHQNHETQGPTQSPGLVLV